MWSESILSNYKWFNYNWTWTVFVAADNHYDTRGHVNKLEKQLYPNNVMSNTFSNRAIECWNCLPNDIVSAPNVNIFKNKLNNVDLAKFMRGTALEP